MDGPQWNIPTEQPYPRIDAQVARPVITIDPKEQYNHFRDIQRRQYPPRADAETRPSESTERPQEKPKKSPKETHAELMSELEQAGKSKDWKDAQLHYHKAIRLADGMNQDEVAKQRQLAQQQLLEEARKSSPDQQKIHGLCQDLLQYQTMQQASSFSRANLGLACMRWGYRDIGSQWIQDAGKRNPGMYADPKFWEALNHATGSTASGAIWRQQPLRRQVP